MDEEAPPIARARVIRSLATPDLTDKEVRRLKRLESDPRPTIVSAVSDVLKLGSSTIRQQRLGAVKEFLKDYPNDNIVGLLVYGSFAKGTADEKSDLDYLPIRRHGTFVAM